MTAQLNLGQKGSSYPTKYRFEVFSSNFFFPIKPCIYLQVLKIVCEVATLRNPKFETIINQVKAHTETTVTKQNLEKRERWGRSSHEMKTFEDALRNFFPTQSMGKQCIILSASRDDFTVSGDIEIPGCNPTKGTINHSILYPYT